MAIIVEAENEFGFNSASCYHKIESFSGNRSGIELAILVYASADARANEKRPFTRRIAIIPYPTVGIRDIMEYCYEQLKQQPGYYNSKDI